MKEEKYEQLRHPILPVYEEESRILILGSFPSVKSREQKFFYGHPQNRFWKVLASVTKEAVPQNTEEKKSLLLRNHIAVWDVIASCEIAGSSDSSIKNVVPNDLTLLLHQAKIQKIYTNGAKAFELYQKFSFSQTGMEAVKLPSTSPANAAYSLDRLVSIWEREIKDYLVL